MTRSPSEGTPTPAFDADMREYITCPKCGYVNRDVCDYSPTLSNDGDTTGYDCDECGAEFTVTLNVSYTYTSALNHA